MTKNFIHKMYGEGERPDTPRPGPDGDPIITEIKTIDRKTVMVRLGEQKMALPSPEYVKSLETIITEMAKKIRRLENSARSVATNHNKLVNEVNSIRKEIKAGKIL